MTGLSLRPAAAARLTPLCHHHVQVNASSATGWNWSDTVIDCYRINTFLHFVKLIRFFIRLSFHSAGKWYQISSCMHHGELLVIIRVCRYKNTESSFFHQGLS